MIVTVAGFKGGVGKTTTAIHLAAYLQQKAPTLLVDGDPNRSAGRVWARGGGLPFKVVDERQAVRYARDFEHVVFDTQSRPDPEDLKVLIDSGDLLVIPVTPDSLALDALMLTVETLKKMGAERYRVLLTIIPPKPNRDGDEAREALGQAGLPVFKVAIRRFQAFQKAALQGSPVYQVKRDRNAAGAWEDYVRVGKEILP